VSDLGSGEQHRRAVRAGGDTGTASDAYGGVERAVGSSLGDQRGMGIRRASSGCADVAARLDDPVQGTAVNHQVFQYRKRFGTPRLDVDHVPVAEAAHLKLTCRY
jgi:hypothetical protein